MTEGTDLRYETLKIIFLVFILLIIGLLLLLVKHDSSTLDMMAMIVASAVTVALGAEMRKVSK